MGPDSLMQEQITIKNIYSVLCFPQEDKSFRDIS